MKKLLKLLLTCFVLSLFIMPSFAKNLVIKENKFDSLIKASTFNKTSTIAVSIKEVNSGNVEYEYNQDKLLNPASTLKMFSTPVAIDALGNDYCFKTQLYIDKNNNLYIKLGADPLLTSLELKHLIRNLKIQNRKTLNNIYIDDSIIDNIDWGTGWMWDDETNPFMPKFSAYNLDENIFKISVSKDDSGSSSKIVVQGIYPIAVMNNVGVSNISNVVVNRYPWQSPDIIDLKGTINTPLVVSVPISNMRRYFLYRLSEYLTTDNIKYKSENIISCSVPKDAKLIAEVSHSMTAVVPLILKNSNNRASETLNKVAAAKITSATGTNDAIVKMINNFYNKNNISTEKIILADASGASRNDLISVNWMTCALNKIYALPSFAFIQDNMAQPGDGTLSNRLFDLRGNVWLKTGSISNVSGITGYVKAKNNKTYSVAILTQSFKQPQSEIKQLEDSIIKLVYEL